MAPWKKCGRGKPNATSVMFPRDSALNWACFSSWAFLKPLQGPKSRTKIKNESQEDFSPAFAFAGTTSRLCAVKLRIFYAPFKEPAKNKERNLVPV
jgi:hypothetical protein